MGAKYTCFYRDSFDQLCRVDITPSVGWSADTISVRGRSEQACIISYEASDDPYEDPIVNSKASISLYNEGQIDIRELQNAADRDFTLELYIENELKWKGFLITDGIQKQWASTPYELDLTATDGLMLLDGIDYTHNNLTGGRCIVNYFRQILFATNNLGINIPLKWVSSLKNEAFPLEDDALSGSVRWSPRGEGFATIYFDSFGNPKYKYKSCLYILTEMASSIQCRLFQSDGSWHLERINDVVSGGFIVRQIIGLDGFSITSKTVNVIKTIAGKSKSPNYAAVDSDHIELSVTGLKKVITTYEHEQNGNILPNGNMDIVDTIFNAPLYWESSNVFSESIPSLSDAKGYGVRVSNSSEDAGFLRKPREPFSVLVDGPADRYKSFFYFKGTAKTGDTIVLTTIDHNTGETTNTYSYTVPLAYNNNTSGALNNMAIVAGTFYETPAISYDAGTEEYQMSWTGFIHDVAGTQTITNSSQGEFTFEGSLPIDTDLLYETINLGFKFAITNGYVLNGDGLIDWSSTTNTIRVIYNRGSSTFYLNENGFWVSTPTDIQITVNQLKPNDIAQIDFNAHQDIKMPIPDITPIDRTNPPSIKIQFNLPSGRVLLLDDVYMTVQDNKNVTEGNFNETLNTKAEEYTLKISSAHSGFYVSSYMTDYQNSGVEKFFSDSVFGGTLTDINTHAILRNRYKPSIQFEGTVYGPTFAYGEIYNIDTLDDKNFLPLKMEWNTETNKIKVSVLEVRNDSININLTQYSTNDNANE